MHENNPSVVHGNVSMANVLLTADHSIAKLSDFALNSRSLYRTDNPTEDIHALGLVAWQLGTGRLVAPSGVERDPSIWVQESKVKADKIGDKRLRELFVACCTPTGEDVSSVTVRAVMSDFEAYHLGNIGKLKL